MKRLALVPCLIAAMLVPSNAQAELPALSGHNVVVGTGPTAALVRLDHDVVVDFHFHRNGPPWFQSFDTNASYAAVLIREATHSSFPQSLFFMSLFDPVGCSESGGCDPVNHNWFMIRTKEARVPETMTLYAGTYWVYVLTDPGERVEVSFDLKGLAGHARLKASVPVDAKMVSNVSPSPTVSHISGKMTHTLKSQGLIAAGTWASPMPTYPDPDRGTSYYPVSCFQRGQGENDPSNTCGGTMGSGFSRHNRRVRGTWTFAYHNQALTQPDGRIGAYALFLTFLK